MNNSRNRSGRNRPRCPALSIMDWRRMLLACPINNKGNMPNGDFLMCGNISQTQWRDACIVGRYTIGMWRFVYIAEHDILVRRDFLDWVIANHRAVLSDASGR